LASTAVVHVTLGDLPRGQDLRVAQLAAVGAECRNKHSVQWREVRCGAIGSVSFDDLSGCWIECKEFRVPSRPNGAIESQGLG
jgi:hypothetical protein